MSYRSFSLIPELSSNLLSDRFTQIDSLFSRLTGEKPLVDTSAYNLLQKDKEHYELIVSVPGYQQDELDVSVFNNQLTIKGMHDVEQNETSDEKDSIKWLHKGIKKNAFSLRFNLDHRIKIQSANLAQGLLTLEFTYDIPEEEKPQKIKIGQKPEAARVIEQKST